MRIRAAHLVENAMPDRDRILLRCLLEANNDCRPRHRELRKSIHLAPVSTNETFAVSSDRTRQRHQVLAPLEPKRENGSGFHRSLLRRSGSGALLREFVLASLASITKMRTHASEATKQRRLPYLLSATGVIFTSSLGQRPRALNFRKKQALKARIIQLLHLARVNRAFSAGRFPPTIPGAMPQAQH